MKDGYEFVGTILTGAPFSDEAQSLSQMIQEQIDSIELLEVLDSRTLETIAARYHLDFRLEAFVRSIEDSWTKRGILDVLTILKDYFEQSPTKQGVSISTTVDDERSLTLKIAKLTSGITHRYTTSYLSRAGAQYEESFLNAYFYGNDDIKRAPYFEVMQTYARWPESIGAREDDKVPRGLTTKIRRHGVELTVRVSGEDDNDSTDMYWWQMAETFELIDEDIIGCDYFGSPVAYSGYVVDPQQRERFWFSMFNVDEDERRVVIVV